MEFSRPFLDFDLLAGYVTCLGSFSWLLGDRRAWERSHRFKRPSEYLWVWLWENQLMTTNWYINLNFKRAYKDLKIVIAKKSAHPKLNFRVWKKICTLYLGKPVPKSIIFQKWIFGPQNWQRVRTLFLIHNLSLLSLHWQSDTAQLAKIQIYFHKIFAQNYFSRTTHRINFHFLVT